MRLFDRYEPLFLEGLRVRESVRQGSNRSQPVDDVQRRLNARIDEVEKSLLSEGKREADVKAASFAMVAWLDEVIAGDPEWFGFDAKPIQVERFSLYDAGEQFYQRLRALPDKQDEVREIYFTALGLGFLGMYALEPESAELKALVAGQARQLPVRPLNPAALSDEKLTPQPYTLPLPNDHVIPSNRDRRFLVSGIVAALLVPLGVYLFLLYRSPSAPAPEPPPTTNAAPAPTPTPTADAGPAFSKVLAAVDCASLKGEVVGGQATVRGYAESAEAVRSLKARVLAIEGIKSVDTEKVAIVPKPLCEVVQVVAAYETEPNLKLALQGGKRKAEMGDTVVAEAEVASAGGFVYVDIYSPDGDVGHMMPDASAKPEMAKGGASIVAGAGDPLLGTQRWQVQPPGGAHLLVSITSPSPLFSKSRGVGENFHEYLKALGPALAGATGAKPVVRFVVLDLGP